MPQMMPMEWTLPYLTFLTTFLMFNIKLLRPITKQKKKNKGIY